MNEMNKALTWWRLLVLMCVVASIAVAMSASGEQAAKPAATFATVNVQKLNSQYKDMQTALSDLQQMQSNFRARLERRRGMVFLTEEEQKQLDTLSEKGAQQTDADKATVKQITDKAGQLKVEFETLSQKPDKELTPDDRTKIADRQKLLQKAQQVFEALNDELNNKLKEFDTTSNDRLDKAVHAAVEKVAQQKGYTIVFNGQIALYAGVDITQAVANELNNPKK